MLSKLAFLSLLTLGCSETWHEAYNGPVQDAPVISAYTQTTIGHNRYGFAKSYRYLEVSNPQLQDVVVDVNCTYAIFPMIPITARTTIKFLIPDEAVSCTITQE